MKYTVELTEEDLEALESSCKSLRHSSLDAGESSLDIGWREYCRSEDAIRAIIERARKGKEDE